MFSCGRIPIRQRQAFGRDKSLITHLVQGLQQLRKTDVPVRLFTDSAYAHGLLTLGWKPRKNEELVRSIRKMLSKFSDLKIIKVQGHAGHAGNERADFLATSAIARARK